MKLFIIKWIIKQIIKRLSGLTEENVLNIIKWVIIVEREFTELDNREKLEKVKTYIKRIKPYLKENICHLIIELIVLYLKKEKESGEKNN